MSPSKFDENTILLENEKDKLEFSKKHQIHLIPVDQQSGEIMKENILRLEAGVFTSNNMSSKDAPPSTSFVEYLKESQKTLQINKENWYLSDPISESATFLKRSTTRVDSRNENAKQATCHGKFRTSKQIQRDTESVDKIGTTGSNAEVGGENQELIEIEMQPDPDTQEIFAGDFLRFKVTMYQFQEKFGKEFDHQVEIDFIQNLVCEPVVQNACRCRRITKLLKRTTFTDLEWQKGMHISGKQFAITWIHYRIPQLDDDSEEWTENKMKSEYLRDVEGKISDGKYERIFKVKNCQFELQIRVYEKVNSLGIEGQSENVLVTCCCFPLYAMPIDN